MRLFLKELIAMLAELEGYLVEIGRVPLPEAASHANGRSSRLDLGAIEATLAQTKAEWSRIERALTDQGIGAKDVAFDDTVMERMLCAYALLDHFLASEVDLFERRELYRICALNEVVHYGFDPDLRQEYRQAILANRAKFCYHIPAIYHWYQRKKSGPKTAKIAAKVFVSILGMPQVFIEGNHRTGALVASWINVTRGQPPFVLSPGNALGFFDPSSKIKHFSTRSYWRGRYKLPKYQKAFKNYWVSQTSEGWRFLK